MAQIYCLFFSGVFAGTAMQITDVPDVCLICILASIGLYGFAAALRQP